MVDDRICLRIHCKMLHLHISEFFESSRDADTVNWDYPAASSVPELPLMTINIIETVWLRAIRTDSHSSSF